MNGGNRTHYTENWTGTPRGAQSVTYAPEVQCQLSTPPHRPYGRAMPVSTAARPSRAPPRSHCAVYAVATVEPKFNTYFQFDLGHSGPDTLRTLGWFAVWGYQPDLFDILPMYGLFVLCMPAALLALCRGHGPAMLLVSLGAYLVYCLGMLLPRALDWPPLAFLGRHSIQVFSFHVPTWCHARWRAAKASKATKPAFAQLERLQR
jgi:hypothetical protein